MKFRESVFEFHEMFWSLDLWATQIQIQTKLINTPVCFRKDQKSPKIYMNFWWKCLSASSLILNWAVVSFT